MVALFGKRPLKATVLAVDKTGVGRPVVDMITKAGISARLKPIMITGGQTVSFDRETGG